MPALRKRHGPMHEINVVPYIDVMLVLLVIFMVTAPLVTPAVIDLPTVGKASQPRIVPLEVFVKSDNAIVVRQRDKAGAIVAERTATRVELASVIKTMRGADAELSVLIGGDKAARYESILGVMDELRKQGVQKVGLQVRTQ
jgi:biopolymer transport protein TolR